MNFHCMHIVRNCAWCVLAVGAVAVPLRANVSVGVAIGTGQVSVTNLSPRWQLESQLITSVNGDPSAYGPNYVCTSVTGGIGPQSAKGTIETTMTYSYIGAGNPQTDGMSVSVNNTATAGITVTGQTAHGDAYAYCNPFTMGEADCVNGPVGTQNNATNGADATIGNASGQIVFVDTTEADASTPN